MFSEHLLPCLSVWEYLSRVRVATAPKTFLLAHLIDPMKER